MGRQALVGAVAVALMAGGTALGAEEAAARSGRRAVREAEVREALVSLGAMVDAMMREDSRREDAPRRLEEALRTGRADADSFAVIAGWILHEKEEDVARGLAQALAGAEILGTGARAERWNGTAQAALAVFLGALREAQHDGHRGGDALSPEMVRLMETARPAVGAALREVDPAVLASLAPMARLLGGAPFGDAVDTLLEALEAKP